MNTFDLGVCMKALPLIWTFPDKFKEHVVIPGPFHAEMNFNGILTNHKMRGSGYAEIIEETRLFIKACIKNLLNGKHLQRLFSVLRLETKLLSACCWMCSAKKKMLKYILHVCLLSLVQLIEIILMQL